MRVTQDDGKEIQMPINFPWHRLYTNICTIRP